MKNSIKQGLDYKTIISNIKLELPANKNSFFVIVEGIFDIRLFSNLVSENVTIYESFDGKKGIEKIISFFFGNKRIIAIRDRDYETRTLDDRIFFCDYSCAEMMIISNQDCFSRICSACSIFENDYVSKREIWLRELLYLSCIRKINEEKRLCFKLEGINVNSLYSDDINVFDKNVLSTLKKHNKDKKIDIQFENLFLQEKENYQECSIEELLRITNGHDFINLMLKKTTKNNVSKNALEISFISSYSKDDFCKTQLYSSLKEYSENLIK